MEDKMTDITEMCICGGEAVFDHWDRTGKLIIPILKCKKCGDTCDAHDKYWR